MKLTIREMSVMNVAQNTCIMIPVPLSEAETVVELKRKLDEGKPLQLELKTLREARTLSANAYCWVLCDEIAVALSKNGVYHSKEDVYRNAIRDCGVNKVIPFANEEAKKAFATMWRRNGIGWVTEDLGRNELMIYFGSSTYDKQQMARLLDALVYEAQMQGIKVKADEEIGKMIDEWGNNNG